MKGIMSSFKNALQRSILYSLSDQGAYYVILHHGLQFIFKEELEQVMNVLGGKHSGYICAFMEF